MRSGCAPGDNKTSVADGLAQTGRVITAAAAIMFCVFGSFVIGDLRVLKVFGLGLAAAVLVDATIVRMVLVPATMELLGDVNWWFPKWLDRILPVLDVEGHPDDAREIDLTDKPSPATSRPRLPHRLMPPASLATDLQAASRIPRGGRLQTWSGRARRLSGRLPVAALVVPSSL